MHALFVVSKLDPKRMDEAERMLRDVMVPKIKESPGFVSGTWARTPDGHARSIAIFSSEEAARKTFDNVGGRIPKEAPIQIQENHLLEVFLQV